MDQSAKAGVYCSCKDSICGDMQAWPRAISIAFMLLVSAAHAAPASTPYLEQVTRMNGDVFIGSVVAENERRLILRVERLIILKGNASRIGTAAEVRMLMHKDGSIFSGRFQLLTGGDFFLNETLYPANFELAKGGIRERRRLETVAGKEQGHLVSFKGQYLFYAEDGTYKEGVQDKAYAAGDRALLQFRSGYALTVNEIRSYLPAGISATLGYARETKSWIPFISRWLPWLYAEAGIFYARNAPYAAVGVLGALGPQWLWRLAANHFLLGQVLFGGNYLRVRDTVVDAAHISPSGIAHVGYGIWLSGYLISASASYHYIHDSETPLSGFGISFGIAKTLGDWN